MEAAVNALHECNIADSQIHYEFFGPALQLNTKLLWTSPVCAVLVFSIA